MITQDTIQTGITAVTELHDLDGNPLPDTETPKGRQNAQLGMRQRQLRDLAVRRANRRENIYDLQWLLIYAETFAKRQGYVGRGMIKAAATSCFVTFTEDTLEKACANAERALKRLPDRSIYSVHDIGRMLHITLEERKAKFWHVGCCEENNAQRDVRRKAERAERDKLRREGKLPGQPAPWLKLGISRSTYYRWRRAGRIAAELGTPIIYRVSLKEDSSLHGDSLTGVSPEEEQARIRAKLSPEGRQNLANLKRVATLLLGGPPTPPDKWPKPPRKPTAQPPTSPPDLPTIVEPPIFDPELDHGMPRVAVMACSEAPDVCCATGYKSTELDDALTAPMAGSELRRCVRVRSYMPPGGGESPWSTQ